MKMNFDLSIQQTQKLVMTQQLQMAIKILQMPSVELNEFLQGQLMENPVIEANTVDRQKEETKIDWKEVARDYDYGNYEEGYQDDDEEVSPLNFVASVTTLSDYLLFQLHMALNDEKDTEIGEYLIDNIDSSGYLRISVQDAAGFLNVKAERVEAVLNTIQTFDPQGVGARTIEECLLIQLSENGILTEPVRRVVSEFLGEVGQNKYNVIAKELSITPKEAQDIGDIIKSLEPKPGRGFPDKGDIKYVIPDVAIEKVGDRYIVTVNDRVTPRLSISPYYRDILKNSSRDRETLDYVKKKLDSAAWLIRSLEQRRTTIFNVVTSIAAFQKEFLDRGLDYLKPLTLKEIAEDVGVHESTVSRAINGKYVQTPRGLYQIKFFFTRGLDASKGENVSSESIKKSIRDIINGEDPAKPLSDQSITDMLVREGINISRRTIAKYREELGIPSTNKRKRF
jgi:RNA polymerase sigma-54 factor